MSDLLNRIRQRKMAQWVAAYAAAAWVLFEALTALAETWLWPPLVGQLAFVMLSGGFGATVVLAWYHGEKGRQRVSGSEVALLLLVALGSAGAADLVLGGQADGPGEESDIGEPPPHRTGDLRRSVLVLPFTDLSPDGGRAYLGDGIAESLINGLARIEELRVVARTSAFAFRESDLEVREIARRVQAGTVLEGSVMQIGDRIRITSNLFDAATGFDLWSERFDREAEASQLFELQDEVAQAILRALAVELGAGNRVVREGTASQEAQRAYYLGLHHWTARTTEDLILAAHYFHEAIGADSSWADAWSGLALAYGLHTPSEYAVPGFSLERGTQLAIDAATRALELDPEQEAAYTALGNAMFLRGQLEEAERNFRRAIELNPGYATAHHWLADLLIVSLRGEEALLEIEEAESLSPVAPAILVEKAEALMALGRTEDALAQMDKAVELLPDAVLVRQWDLYFGATAGDWNRAAEGLRQLAILSGLAPEPAAQMADALRDPERREAMLVGWRDGASEGLAGASARVAAVSGRVEGRFVAARYLDGDGAALDLLEEMALGPHRDAIYGPILPALMGPELSRTPRARELIRLVYARYTGD